MSDDSISDERKQEQRYNRRLRFDGVLPIGTICRTHAAHRRDRRLGRIRITAVLSEGGQSHLYLARCEERIYRIWAGDQSVPRGTKCVVKVYRSARDLPGSTALAEQMRRARRSLATLRFFARRSEMALIHWPTNDILESWFSGNERTAYAAFERKHEGYFPRLICEVDDIKFGRARRDYHQEEFLRMVKPIVVEYIPGRSLSTVFQEGRMPTPDAAEIARSLLQQVDALQELKYIHRDINPSNVIVGPHGPFAATLIDFGFCRYINGNHKLAALYQNWKDRLDSEEYTYDSAAEFVGGFRARPPETYRGFLSREHDSYSLGLLIFALFTGEHLVSLGDDPRDCISYRVAPTHQEKMALDRRMRELLRGRYGWARFDSMVADRLASVSSIPRDFARVVAELCQAHPQRRSWVREALNSLGVPRAERKGTWFV